MLCAENELEAVLQGHDVRIRVLLELEGVGDDLNGPATAWTIAPRLVAEPEVSREFGHGTESIHEAGWVSAAILLEPIFWGTC